MHLNAPAEHATESAVCEVTHTAEARLPTRHGTFAVHTYQASDGHEHVALVMGEVRGGSDVLVRLHSECFTGDVLGSLRCDCGEQLEQALATIAKAGQGVVVYLRGHEGRGIGLADKLRAYQLQDLGCDTVEANEALGLPVDARRFDAGAAILRNLGVTRLRLLSNNPYKSAALQALGLEVAAHVPLAVSPNPENLDYLRTKQHKLGHRLPIEGDRETTEAPVLRVTDMGSGA